VERHLLEVGTATITNVCPNLATKSLCNAPVCSVSKVVGGENITYSVQYLCNDIVLMWSAHRYLLNGRSKIPAGNVFMLSINIILWSDIHQETRER